MEFSNRRGARRLKLRTRFLLAYIAVVAATTVLIAAAAGTRFVSDMERMVEGNGRAIAQIFAREALFQLTFQQKDRVALKTVLESFVSGDMIYGQIVFNGEVVDEKNRLEIPLPVERLLPGLHTVRKGLSSGSPYLDIVQSFEGRTQVDPGLRPELVDSYVRLGLTFGQQREEIEWAVVIVVAVALGATLAGTLLLLVYYRRTWKPLEVIKDAMQSFGSGTTHVRARVHSGDELELLSRSFNEMANAIEKKDVQMAQAHRELRRANRAKSDFLAAMSHDLKTPLHVISGYTQLLLEGDGGTPSEVQKTHLATMLRASDRLLEFIERILSFSKTDSGDEPMRREPVDVAELTEDVVHALGPLAKRKGLALHLEVASRPTLMADAAKLRQILSNLVENAIKYTATGEVGVRLFWDKGGVCWTVCDTGPGIPEAFEGYVFEPFGRLDNPVGTTEGIGLGLAIVKRYVEAHAGRVTLRSTPGGGSTFTVFLPQEVSDVDDSDR